MVWRLQYWDYWILPMANPRAYFRKWSRCDHLMRPCRVFTARRISLWFFHLHIHDDFSRQLWSWRLLLRKSGWHFTSNARCSSLRDHLILHFLGHIHHMECINLDHRESYDLWSLLGNYHPSFRVPSLSHESFYRNLLGHVCIDPNIHKVSAEWQNLLPDTKDVIQTLK